MTMTMNPMSAVNAPAAPALAVGQAANAVTPASPALPFAPLLMTTDGAPAMTATDGVTDETTDETTDTAPVDGLDTAWMQALDELLHRGPSTKAATSEVDATADDERAAATPTVAPAPTTAMLMPTLIPGVMPPTPARALAASADRSEAIGSAAPTAPPAAKSALATDLAGLLAIPGSDAVSSPADVPAWQGLQRWSADLMTAMASAASATSAAAGGTALAEGGEAMAPTLTLPASREAWQQPLMQALGDRLQLQIAQRADSARLHLSPPQLGRIEIDIRQQGGALQVQLSASNDEVRQQLRQIAEPLRHELVQRHAGDVSVQVASGAQAAGDGRGRDGAAAGGQPQSNGQQRDAQRQPGRALQDDDTGAASASGAFAFADVLAGNTRTPR